MQDDQSGPAKTFPSCTCIVIKVDRIRFKHAVLDSLPATERKLLWKETWLFDILGRSGTSQRLLSNSNHLASPAAMTMATIIREI